ncbi:hypothetical protein [Microbulbifer epialgicus]|uniref:Uncharacterized protein n=1 Tax=Microbulbifer epialgicus TaxID=393907 RepID=A0ABV4P604_9GAMM
MLNKLKFRSILAVLPFLLGASDLYAAQWISNVEILKIFVQPNARMYLKVSGSVPDLNCAGNEEGMLEFDTDAPHFKEQYSLILSAYMANKPVSIYVNGCGHYPYASNTTL